MVCQGTNGSVSGGARALKANRSMSEGRREVPFIHRDQESLSVLGVGGGGI